eukprot:Gb_29457 [translate_table: standard]
MLLPLIISALALSMELISSSFSSTILRLSFVRKLALASSFSGVAKISPVLVCFTGTVLFAILFFTCPVFPPISSRIGYTFILFLMWQDEDGYPSSFIENCYYHESQGDQAVAISKYRSNKRTSPQQVTNAAINKQPAEIGKQSLQSVTNSATNEQPAATDELLVAISDQLLHPMSVKSRTYRYQGTPV